MKRTPQAAAAAPEAPPYAAVAAPTEGAAVYMRRRGAKGAAVSGGALNFARIARALEPPEAAPQAAAAAPKVPP